MKNKIKFTIINIVVVLGLHLLVSQKCQAVLLKVNAINKIENLIQRIDIFTKKLDAAYDKKSKMKEVVDSNGGDIKNLTSEKITQGENVIQQLERYIAALAASIP